MIDLKECPFCGNHPSVSTPEWRDENRYVGMDISCCTTMEVAIGWRKARDMTKQQWAEELNALAAEQWNRRYSPESPTQEEKIRDAHYALTLALQYWNQRQQRYKNRFPVWVIEAKKALAALYDNA